MAELARQLAPEVVLAELRLMQHLPLRLLWLQPQRRSSCPELVRAVVLALHSWEPVVHVVEAF